MVETLQINRCNCKGKMLKVLVEIVSGRHNVNSRLPMGERFLLERAWDYYERNELALLIDDALDRICEAEEACRFLKIALLCTQDNPKLRPSMSTVVKMLTGKVDVSNKEIQRPGLISDLTELKVGNDPQEGKVGEKCPTTKTTNDYNIYSSSENLETSGLSSLPSTFADVSFSSHDKSI